LLNRSVGKPGRLIIGIGNPSRGDDALGPLAIERLAALNLPDVELLTDFQLQVEYLLDLAGRKDVVFIDATMDSRVEAYAFQQIRAVADDSYSSHALSPQALLAAYERHYGRPPPPCHVLAIRARAFELGEGLSPEASAALEAAVAFLSRRPATGHDSGECPTA
jgi:hydrogenase maturation protease